MYVLRARLFATARRMRPLAAALVQYLSLSRVGTVRYFGETWGLSRLVAPAVVAYVVCMYRIRARAFSQQQKVLYMYRVRIDP